MPNPYEALVDVRQFLNLPGFHDGAYVVACREREPEVKRLREKRKKRRTASGNGGGRTE